MTEKPKNIEYDEPLDMIDSSNLIEGDILVIATSDDEVYEFKVEQNIEHVLIVRHINCDQDSQQTGIINNKTIQCGEPLYTKFPPPLSRTANIEQIMVTNPNLSDEDAFDQRVTTRFVREDIEQAVTPPEVVAIGDSNGSYETYIWNLKKTGLIDEDTNWIGGNRRVVIHGDILADRACDGLQILHKNAELRKQAQEAGGDITILAGNHDDFMFSFLLNRGGVHDNGLQASLTNKQGEGLRELTLFSGDRQMRESLYVQGEDGDITYDELSALLIKKNMGYPTLPTIEEFDQIDEIDANMRKKGSRFDREEILENMRNDDYGKMILEEMCNMKLCERIDNTLYVHSDPTNEMLGMLLRTGVDSVNNDFQTAMRKTLLEGEQYNDNYNNIFDTFLSTNNRSFAKALDRDGKMHEDKISLKPGLVKMLKERTGIDKIVFGHSDLKKGQRKIEIEGVKFINVDQSSLKGGKQTISAARLRADGRVVTGTERHIAIGSDQNSSATSSM